MQVFNAYQGSLGFASRSQDDPFPTKGHTVDNGRDAALDLGDTYRVHTSASRDHNDDNGNYILITNSRQLPFLLPDVLWDDRLAGKVGGMIGVYGTQGFEGQVMTALGTFFSGRGMEIVDEMLVFSGEGLSEVDRERAFALGRKVAAYKQMEEENV